MGNEERRRDIHMRVTRLENITHGPPRLENIEAAFHRSRAWATLEEAQILCDHIKNYGVQLAVEIGTCNGFTAACLATTGVKVQTFDLEDKEKIYDKGTFPYPELRDNIQFEAVPSPECFSRIILPEGPVLFFIDGDHTYEACNRDFNDVLQIARPIDLVFIHDVRNVSEVKNWWRAIVARLPSKTTTMKTRNGLGLFRP